VPTSGRSTSVRYTATLPSDGRRRARERTIGSDPGGIVPPHAGSLPRPDDLIRMMWAKGDGIPVDEAALARRVAAAVHEVTARQIDAGGEIVNDGEGCQ